jgi:hypothetical protein
MAIHVWNQEIGPSLKVKSMATMVRGKALYVTVEEPVWAQQLSLISSDLAARINEAAGAEVVSQVRFRIGQIRPAMAWKEPEEQANRELYDDPPDPDGLDSDALSPSPDRLPWRRRELIQSVATRVDDEDVRRRLERLLLLDEGWHRWQRENLSAPAMAAVKVLRKEPWLSDDEVKAVGAGFVSELGPGVVDELKKASSWDLARARRVVMDECAEEVEALVAAGALDSEAGRGRVRVMIGCMVMLAAGCRPSDIDEELVLEHAGPTYLEYFRKARGGRAGAQEIASGG